VTAGTAFVPGAVGGINVRARRRRRLVVAGMVAPAVLVIGGALVVPALNLIVQSFLVSTGYGGVAYHFTFSN
jgi:hypothetical protein